MRRRIGSAGERYGSTDSIDVLMTKNSGGTMATANLADARTLGLPVVTVQRPPRPAGPEVADVVAARAWVDGRTR